MKAIVQQEYGSPSSLELREVEAPAAEAGEVLVRVRAASVHPDVWHVVTGRPYALRVLSAGALRPKTKIPGTDVAGYVASVGGGVTRFVSGDEVFGETVAGNSWRHGGAYAEYASVPESCLWRKPVDLTFEQAASVPTSGLIALRSLLALGKLRAGSRILINGAGGNVGSLAVQIAKAHEAVVTGVDSARKLTLMRSVGADHVIDYAETDITQGSESYEFILDVASTLSLTGCKRVLTSEGSYAMIGHDQFGESAGRWFGSMPRFAMLLARSRVNSRVASPDFSIASSVLMASLGNHVDRGQIAPVIDRAFSLDESARAIQYMQTGQPCGAVVISMQSSVE